MTLLTAFIILRLGLSIPLSAPIWKQEDVKSQHREQVCLVVSGVLLWSCDLSWLTCRTKNMVPLTAKGRMYRGSPRVRSGNHSTPSVCRLGTGSWAIFFRAKKKERKIGAWRKKAKNLTFKHFQGLLLNSFSTLQFFDVWVWLILFKIYLFSGLTFFHTIVELFLNLFYILALSIWLLHYPANIQTKHLQLFWSNIHHFKLP